MKKFFFVILLLSFSFVLFLNKTNIVWAEQNEVKGLVNISLDMPKGVIANVTITLTNLSDNKETIVMLPAANGNKYTFLANMGTYNLKDFTVKTTDGYVLDYIVVMDDFTLDTTSKEDFVWNVVGSVKAKVPLYSENETESINHREDIKVLVIESSNAYFPGKTVDEIKQWYVENVKEFLQTGQSDYALQDFQNAVAEWSDWVMCKKETTLQMVYNVDVLTYNTDSTQEFFEVQKKLYNFIWDYYKEKGLCLNFETWEEEDTEILVTRPEKETSLNIDNNNVIDNARPEKKDEIEDIIDSSVVQEENVNKFVSIIRQAWFTLLILFLLLIIVFFIKLKNKKIEDE